jgi:hypothetical protein
MNGRLPLLHVVQGFSCLVCCLNMSADTLDSSDDSHSTQTRAKMSKVWEHYEQNPLVMYVLQSRCSCIPINWMLLIGFMDHI